MIQDYFNLAVRNLMKKRLRSSLTIIGIFISIATIFVLISLSIGLDGAVKEQFRQLGSDKFFIMPRGQAGPPGAGRAVQLTIKDVEVIEKINGVKDVSYDTIGNAKVEFNDEIRYLMIAGIPLDKSDVFIETGFYKIDDGRFLKKGDVGKIMIGSRFKETLYKKSVKEGNKIIINGKEFEVVGILQTIGNSQDDSLIFMGLEDFKELFNSEDRVDQIIVQIKSGEDINKIADNTRRKLISFRGVTEKTRDFEIMTPEELLKSFGVVLNIITAFLLGIAGISLLVGAVGIANTMYTSVLERTKEIGTMKAIGAKNSDIMKIFILESGIFGLIGGILGAIFGLFLSWIVSYSANSAFNQNILAFSISWSLLIGAILFSSFIGIVAGLIPSYSASKMKPVDALRS